MKVLIALLLAVSATAYAGTYPVPVNSPQIVTPDIATGFQRFEYYSITLKGDLVVCINRSWYSRGYCNDDTGANRWKLLKDVVPIGKTYVGFVHDMYRQELYVYWK